MVKVTRDNIIQAIFAVDKHMQDFEEAKEKQTDIFSFFREECPDEKLLNYAPNGRVACIPTTPDK